MSAAITPERLHHAFSGLTRTNHLGEEFDLRAMRELVRRLENPQDGLRVVHVGGTAGKGSVSRMTAEMLSAAGHRVGLYTKPHMHSLTERFVVDGRPIGDDDLLARAEAMRPHLDGLGASWFEAVTALALRYFADQEVDVAVVEVGMGGRTDATNVVHPIASVITNVGNEHLIFLGGTLASVAGHKAGIIKSGATTISGATSPEAAPVVRARAAEVGSPLLELGDDIAVLSHECGPDGSRFDVRLGAGELSGVRLGMVGRHQVDNAALALAAVESLAAHGLAVPKDAAKTALAAVSLPGRLETVGSAPTVLLDSAHCPPKLEALGAALSGVFPRGGRRVAVLALSPSQDPEESMAALAEHLDAAVVTGYTGLTEFGAVRGVDPERLAAALHRVAPGLPVTVEPDPVVAYQRALADAGPDDLVCVTGSFSLVSTIRAHAAPDHRGTV